MDKTQRFWHLAKNESEADVADFELQLWRLFHAFMRWQEECEQSANDTHLTGQEIAILHVIRMHDKAKTISDIGRILKRNDVFNINYILRKLLRQGLVKKSRPAKGAKKFVYEITDKGITNTEVFYNMKRNILVPMFVNEKTIPLQQITNHLIKIRSIYDEADSAVAYTNPDKVLEKSKISSKQNLNSGLEIDHAKGLLQFPRRNAINSSLKKPANLSCAKT